MAHRRNPLGKRFDVPKTKGLVLARLGQKGKRVHIVNPKTGRTLCEPENPDLYASEAQVADCYRCLKLIDLNQQNRGSILSVPTRGNPDWPPLWGVHGAKEAGSKPSRYHKLYVFRVLEPQGQEIEWTAWGKNLDEAFNQPHRPILPGRGIVGWEYTKDATPVTKKSHGWMYSTGMKSLSPEVFISGHLVYPPLPVYRSNTIFERQFIPSHEGDIYDSSGRPYRQQHSMIVGGRQGTWIGKKKKKTKGAKPSSPFTSKLAEGKTPPKARTQSKKTRAYLERQKAAQEEGRSTGLEAAIDHLIEEAKLKAMARGDMPLKTPQGLILYFVEGWPVSDTPGAEERLREEMRKHPAQFQALRSTTKGFRAKRRAPYGSRKRKLPRLKTNPPKPKERTMALRSHKKNPVHHLSRKELVLLAQMETARMGRKVTMDDLLETGPRSMFKGRIKLKGGKRKAAANPRRRNAEPHRHAQWPESIGRYHKRGRRADYWWEPEESSDHEWINIFFEGGPGQRTGGLWYATIEVGDPKGFRKRSDNARFTQVNVGKGFPSINAAVKTVRQWPQTYAGMLRKVRGMARAPYFVGGKGLTTDRQTNPEKLTAAEQRELEKAFGKKAKLGKKQKRGTVREDVHSYFGARPSYATPIRTRANKKAKKVRYRRNDGKTIWCTPKQARAYRRNRG
jgi:hypothetical protein